MITNCVVTIYNRVRGSDGDVFKRTTTKAWYHKAINETLSAGGMKAGTNITNVASIRIPDLNIEVKEGDLIVKGIGAVSIESVKDLPDHHVVISVHKNTFGHSPHIFVKAI